MKFFLSILVLFFFQTQYLYAYLDPGSGSILLQALLFIIAGIVTFFSFFKSKLSELKNKIFRSKKSDPTNKDNKER